MGWRIDDELQRWVRLRAAERGCTARDVVEDLIRAAVEQGAARTERSQPEEGQDREGRVRRPRKRDVAPPPAQPLVEALDTDQRRGCPNCGGDLQPVSGSSAMVCNECQTTIEGATG